MNLTKDTERFVRWCGSVSAAARVIGIPRTSLHRQLSRHGCLDYEHRLAVERSGYVGRDRYLYRVSDAPPRIVYAEEQEVIEDTAVVEVDVSPDETGEPDDFDRAWAEYPSRHGTNSRKDARYYFEVRLRQGADPQAMIDGTIRYRKYCEVNDMVNTSVVMQGRRFYGRGCHYEQEWETPKDKNEIDLEALENIFDE